MCAENRLLDFSASFPIFNDDKIADSAILFIMETQKLAGYLLIEKPKDITSFECIRKLQKLVGYKKGIGHTGTLDPFATGLLIIAFDRSATKHIDKFLKLDKTYIATGKLGELTDTLDHTGELIGECDTSVTQDDIITAIKALGNQYTQTPPLYAALKYQGEPLYKLARMQKLSVEELSAITQEKQRTVTLYSLELMAFEHPFFTIKAHVSHGTYIRSLVNDIAQLAGSFATTYELERIKIGSFKLENAVELDSLKTQNDIEKNIISVEDMLQMLSPADY